MNRGYTPVITFSGYTATSNTAVCDCCGAKGKITIIRYPQTSITSTRYKELWLCNDCLMKLHNTVRHAVDTANGDAV